MEMAETSEPPNKKSKTENVDEFLNNIIHSKTNLSPIMDDMYTNSVPLIMCYAGHVKEITQLSSIIKTLNEKLPLQDLHHLKRVFKHSVLICSVNHFKKFNYACIDDFIQEHVPELNDSFEYIRDVEVPAVPPLTKKQNVFCTKKWICNFHPNKYIERMLGDSFFTQRELSLHRTYMGIAFEMANMHLTEKDSTFVAQDVFAINAAVVVDPIINTVVALAFDNRERHPIQHAAMVAIDNVAKTQNSGGVWVDKVAKSVIWKLRNKFFDITFGARQYVSKKDSTDSKAVEYSPYLCTGYDIYLVQEPCVMCAMGLVHARIKRVFYTVDNHLLGALRSRTKLHCVPQLNHRFEVFTGFHN